VSFDPCHDCGPGYAGLVFLGILWLAPFACVAMRRHVGSATDLGRQLLRPIRLLTASALAASWQYVTSPYF
jgi:hypothetical protein